MKNYPKPQSKDYLDHTELTQKVIPEEQYVWAVFNSGDSLWDNYAIELLLFVNKQTALLFVRAILKEFWQIKADTFDDEVVENLMFSNDDDRYLHLFKLRVHPENYGTFSIPWSD